MVPLQPGSLFLGTTFNQDISDWDVSSGVNMYSMFHSNSAFNQNINGWTTSSLTNMQYIFWHTGSFNQPLSNWDVSKVTSFFGAFEASKFNQDISNWNVAAGIGFDFMFFSSQFNQDLCDWGNGATALTSTNLGNMFASSGCPDTSNPSFATSPRGPFCYSCP
ncbi:(Lipo)protein [Seminavis robusta]|uniref:(Lipo)protein n=1 Tax=Seminavis robusta TaxID=568900 RepID=A0A9N8EPM2_9STRA|nr:(Lipo)protein [Seminavis robusta]|eukprot:Sro1708_g292680.1 (Lipo)protein (163) ;mRNA; r:12007-13251